MIHFDINVEYELISTSIRQNRRNTRLADLTPRGAAGKTTGSRGFPRRRRAAHGTPEEALTRQTTPRTLNLTLSLVSLPFATYLPPTVTIRKSPSGNLVPSHGYSAFQDGTGGYGWAWCAVSTRGLVPHAPRGRGRGSGPWPQLVSIALAGESLTLGRKYPDTVKRNWKYFRAMPQKSR